MTSARSRSEMAILRHRVCECACGHALVLAVLVVAAAVGQGGVAQGDPAPGRSPGPPLDADPHSCDEYANSTPERSDPQHITIELTHPLFNTERGIVPGVFYEVRVNVRADVEDWSLVSVTSELCLRPRARSAIRQLAFNWSLPTNTDRPDNATFRIRYRIQEDRVFESLFHFAVAKDCTLYLKHKEANVSSSNMPEVFRTLPNCSLAFPSGPGLVVVLTRLNVRCALGHLRLSPADPSQERVLLCGKLEEIAAAGREVYFRHAATPVRLSVVGRPIFSLSYHLVDYCFNVTYTQRNHSFEINPSTGTGLLCNYRITLPYGHRVSLDLRVFGATAAPGDRQEAAERLAVATLPADAADPPCDGLLVRLWDGPTSWSHCARAGDPARQLTVISRENRVALRVASAGGGGSLRVDYDSVSVGDVVQGCEWGWVAVKQFCVRVVEERRVTWADAELECVRRNGHLVSIRSAFAQQAIDAMLLNSPGYAEHNAYWVGATDQGLEGDFRWVDGLPFAYTNWFPGWSQHNHVLRQPNDDFLSEEDCVEVRRLYHRPGAAPAHRLTDSYMWNDRDCSTRNYYICEKLQNGAGPLEELQQGAACNRTVSLTADQPRAALTSPGFPRSYPDNVECHTLVLAPPGYRIVVDFDELILEDERVDCGYDVLELLEPGLEPRRVCGDWSDRIKLLRHVSASPRLTLRFVSDYSHHFGGFKARVSMEHAHAECGDDRLQQFNGSCYLFVSYPEVTWQTAKQICKGLKADLASVHSPDEERFVVSRVRASREYNTNAIHWLGAQQDSTGNWYWVDSTPMSYTAWLSGESGAKGSMNCLSLQWMSAPAHLLPSSLYWQPQLCANVGGYVCKKESQGVGKGLNLNGTVNATEGRLTSPRFPATYHHNLDYWVRLVAPKMTRLVVRFSRLDLEPQPQCLYDFLELEDVHSQTDTPRRRRYCGYQEPTTLDRLNFVSESSEVLVHFRSDYSISGSGFALSWRSVDVSGCPLLTLTAKEGLLTSPNYPHFLLDHLDCSTTILAPVGRRVWLQITDFELESAESSLGVSLGDGSASLQPFKSTPHMSDGVFVSQGERLQVRLKTGDNPRGRGFKAVYKSVHKVVDHRITPLNNLTSGWLLHVNFPHPPPPNLDFTDRLVAPLGKAIHLQFYRTEPTFLEDEGGRGVCPGQRGVIEVRDNYADTNGTWWRLCETEHDVPPLAITSYLNTLLVRQINGAVAGAGVRLNVSVVLKNDINYKSKLLQGSSESPVEACAPNPCLNGGKCVSSASKRSCQCVGYFTGMFCALTLCELDPCLFGRCELTLTGFRCHCNRGYEGEVCDTKQHPCAHNPCEGRGDCVERPDSTFHCRCHAWWEGARCERRMMHIPYKPLSQRMLQEPFWLGLITVTVVLGVLGLFWCAKRHFPEKLEKLLAEEADRSRHCHMSGRTASVRDQLPGSLYANNPVAVTTGPSSAMPPPRTLFGRLGIRKPSLLSLSSPLVPPAHTARTFSLDDLLRPPARRSPSPRKKRVNSTPTKKSVAAVEKKMILQHLMAPAVRVASTESVAMSLAGGADGGEGPAADDIDAILAETSFTIDSAAAAAAAAMAARTQELKQEKKVTFARLLDKVSSEMSSGSELECSMITIQPPSPLKELRSPNSTSSNQGSDSLSSSDVALSVAPGELARRPGKLLLGPSKANSADSILAMFRKMDFASGGAGGEVAGISPSTTPTASTPQDDVAGSDDSSTNTPVSSSSGSPPMFHRKHTIQVSVLDPLSAQKGGSGLLQPPTILLEVPNKCLSPIKEVPTPAPSPALTPVMPRHLPLPLRLPPPPTYSNKPNTLAVPVSGSSSLVIPTLRVQMPSPTQPSLPRQLFPGSPPPHKEPPFAQRPGRLLKDLDKPTSLDLPVPPPLITVTCSMSEVESDGESPAAKSGVGSTGGMCYLSPFSMCTRADRTTSESNLSSSGYSSMASPGPSRCGSNNPLCPESDDSHQTKKPSPLLRTPRTNDTILAGHRRGRSDSETLSDDLQIESNDEGFGTDHLDDKIEGGELKSAKELEVFIGLEMLESGQNLIGLPISPTHKLKHCSSFESNLEQKGFLRSVKPCGSVEAGLDCYRLAPPPNDICKVSLKLPSIVVDADPSGVDNHCSPVSSRSESPLSDKMGGISRFSPMFYGKLTDSDGLYDCASSDCCKIMANKKHSGRRRERKRSKSPNLPKETKDGKESSAPTQMLLDVPGKSEPHCRHSPRSKPSPKRRLRTHSQIHSSTSSSSTESINSIGEVCLNRATPDGARSPERGWSKLESTWASDSSKVPSNEASGEDTAEEATVTSQMLPKPNRKISRLRTVGHQIRFLRRLEQSIRRWDSPDEGDDSGAKEPLTRSHSSGRLSRLRATLSEEPLLSQEDRAWRRVNIIRSGHTD